MGRVQRTQLERSSGLQGQEGVSLGRSTSRGFLFPFGLIVNPPAPRWTPWFAMIRCWEAELAVIREDEALEAAMRHQVSTISSQAVMPPSPVTLDGGDEYRMRDDGL